MYVCAAFCHHPPTPAPSRGGQQHRERPTGLERVEQPFRDGEWSFSRSLSLSVWLLLLLLQWSLQLVRFFLLPRLSLLLRLVSPYGFVSLSLSRCCCCCCWVLFLCLCMRVCFGARGRGWVMSLGLGIFSLCLSLASALFYFSLRACCGKNTWNYAKIYAMHFRELFFILEQEFLGYFHGCQV